MVKTIADPRQGIMFAPETTWRPPTRLPNLAGVKLLALDTETHDPNLQSHGTSVFRGGGKVVGMSLAWDRQSIYLPFSHEGGDNLDRDQVLGWLRECLWHYTGVLMCANILYDLLWLREAGVLLNPEVQLYDVQMVEALLDENKLRYNLASITETYRLQAKDEVLLQEAASTFGLDPKADLWRLPARYVGPYAERDAAVLLEIYARQQPLIVAQKLERVVKLEHDLIPLLVEMRWRGIRVDVDKAELHLKQFMAESEGYRDQVQGLTGYRPDIWAPDSCGVALDKAGIRFKQTATGKPSITDEWLQTFPEGSVPWLINRARKTYKAGQTFCQGMVLDHAVNGRVHAEIHPLRSDDGGTVSGRFSMSNPNLQQASGRDPRMFLMIRGLFLPEEGEEWAAVDYASQEPRLTVHYAAELDLRRGQEVAARYVNDPSTDYHSLVAELVFGPGFSKDERKKAKTINLGLAYGMGGAKLCRSLGLSTLEWTSPKNGRTYDVAGDEGKELLARYHAEVPFIKELSDHYMRLADQDGQVRTLSGRLCRFPLYEPLNGGRAVPYDQAVSTYGQGNVKRAFTYRALNRKIQSGAADTLKIAMRNLWREGVVPLVTIHDELGFSVSSREQLKRYAEIMENCVKLRVPLRVDIDIGPTWGEAKPLEEN